jgi:Outer membrane protein beta-barrel domain
MKMIRTIILALAAVAIAATVQTAKPESILDQITIAPVAALQTENLVGESRFGAGLDLGFDVNPFVSLHGTALTYETENWKGSVVDESELYGRANFVKFKNETFVFYGKGGLQRDWQESIWGFGVGAGAELRLSKNVALGADYTVRSWFKGREKDSLARALVQFSF